MKKITTKLTSIILAIVFLFSGMFSLLISASTETDSPFCLEDHFSNLHMGNSAHVPPNPIGSCPYVAMSMFLSFYDSYWDDDFIVEDLDWDNGVFNSSTETLSSTFSASSERQAWIDWQLTHTNPNFVDYELANQGSFLQPYLISLGRFAGYHSNVEENGYGLTSREIVDFLKAYLYNVRGFTEDQIRVCYQKEGLFGVSQEELNQTIIDKISEGYPVIYCGNTINYDLEIDSLEDFLDIKTGHAMIAYSTSDEANDTDRTIYLHEGYNGNPTNEETTPYTTVEDTEYQYGNVAIWIEITDELPHNCSNNYYDVETNSYVCACNVYYETHDSHVHFYNNEYSVMKHFGECICGNVVSEETHNFKYSSITSTTHHEKCRGCNYEITVNHYYDTFEILEDGHKGKCECGASIIEAHSESKYVISTKAKHFVYCKCGYFYGSEAHHMTTVGSRSVCADCGYVGSSGITPPYEDSIFKSEEDETTE